MSKWEELNIANHIREILKKVKYYRKHHFRKPFLTAYQLAIKFSQRFPDATRELGFRVGGIDTGERNSLAQYLAGQLSRRIKSGELTDVEGAFISNNDLSQISFKDRGRIIVSSLTNTGFDLSMFRLRGKKKR